MLETNITFRIDVDYPYSSRAKSFLSVFLGVKLGEGYLQNAKAIAEMINSSAKAVKAYWFFTTKTLPDEELKELIINSKHEICLHAVSDVEKELEKMRSLGYTPKLYTKHGISSFFSKVVWRSFSRNLETEKLELFHDEDCFSLDRLCYMRNEAESFDAAKAMAKKRVISLHPVWLTQKGKFNKRASYRNVLKLLLEVND